MATVFPSAMQRNAVLMAAQDSAGLVPRVNSVTPTENASAPASRTAQENTVVKTVAGDDAEPALLARHVARNSSVQQVEGEVTAAVVLAVAEKSVTSLETSLAECFVEGPTTVRPEKNAVTLSERELVPAWPNPFALME